MFYKGTHAILFICDIKIYNNFHPMNEYIETTQFNPKIETNETPTPSSRKSTYSRWISIKRWSISVAISLQRISLPALLTMCFFRAVSTTWFDKLVTPRAFSTTAEFQDGCAHENFTEKKNIRFSVNRGFVTNVNCSIFVM